MKPKAWTYVITGSERTPPPDLDIRLYFAT